MVDVWIHSTGPAPTDDFGRYRSRSGARFLAEAAKSTRCPDDLSRPCHVIRAEDGRWFCGSCLSGWSVSHTQNILVAARARSWVGVDIETPKRRNAAFRWLGRVTGVPSVGIEQWTQGEALWKAMGNAARRPKTGELRLSPQWHYGWQSSADGDWYVHTAASRDAVWSLASQNVEPLTLHSWSPLSDSNRRPPLYKSGALAN